MKLTRTCLALAVCMLLVPSTLPAKFSAKKATAAIRKAAKGEDYEQLNKILVELGKSDDPKATPVVLSALSQVPPHEVLEAAIAALVQLGVDNVQSSFDKICKSRKTNEELLAVVVAVAGELQGDAPDEWLVRGVESRSYYVYRNAIPSLVARKSKKAVPALIDLLDHVGYKQSAESYVIRDALIALTGLDFEAIEDWRKWWKGNGESFDPTKLDEGGKTAVARKKPGEIEGYKTPKFFGVEVLSSRIVFVVDVSGSMQMWDEEAEKVPGVKPEWKQRERLTRVKHHLQEAVQALPDYTWFNIISFSWKEKKFNPVSVQATAKWKKKARDWISALRADGPTNTLDALEQAFEDKGVDTIFLLSDGAPTGENKKTKDLMAEILESVAKRNRLAKIKIYTFGFEGEGKLPPGQRRGPPPANPDPDAVTLEDLIDFLKKLATDSGGAYEPVA